jgi:hypothetical protein
MTIISLLSVGIFGLIIGMSIGYGAGYEECLTLKMTKKQKEKYYQDKATLNQLNKYE